MKNKYLRLFLYGLGVFVVFITIALILKRITNQVPTETEIFWLFTKTDLLLGLAVAVAVTFSHEKKKRLK
jgi:hypothetical protein